MMKAAPTIHEHIEAAPLAQDQSAAPAVAEVRTGAAPVAPPILLHIGADGRIRGLWADEIDLLTLGPVRVRRASYVEFDQRRQQWSVREARPSTRLRRRLQWLLRRPMGHVLHRFATRSAALAWEQEHFAPADTGARQ